MRDNRGDIRVVVAEDDAAVRRVIVSLLESEDGIDVVGEAGDGEEALGIVNEHAPHVVVMDLHMPRLSGLEATRILSDIHPTTRVLVLTVSDEQQDIFEAIHAGAAGYLLKDSDMQSVAGAVRCIRNGQAVLTAAITPRLMTELAKSIGDEDHPALRPPVTARELDILQHLAAGKGIDEIAETMAISLEQAGTHVLNVLRKMQTRERMRSVVDAVLRIDFEPVKSADD